MGSFAPERTPEHRDILLKAVTIGVLFASTGLAWLFVRARSSAVDRAKSTMVDSAVSALEQIRNEGLDKRWGTESEAWYLLYVDRGLSGWRTVIRWREPDGTHQGLHVVFPKGLWEYWQLDARGTAGRYEAGEVVAVRGSPHLARRTTTKIILNQGRVELHQPQGVSRADAPENYVPEGMLDLACFVAAERGSEAEFGLILNSDPPDGNTTRFASVTVSDIRPVRGGLQAAVKISSVRGGSDTTTVLFDRAGRVLERTAGATEERLVARDTVERIFRQAPGHVGQVLRGVTASAASRPGPTTTSAPAGAP